MKFTAMITNTQNKITLIPGKRLCGAGNEIRTRDTKLGKLVLYQLSYARSTVQIVKTKNRLCQQVSSIQHHLQETLL